jgi:hypothetical protein
MNQYVEKAELFGQNPLESSTFLCKKSDLNGHTNV